MLTFPYTFQGGQKPSLLEMNLKVFVISINIKIYVLQCFWSIYVHCEHFQFCMCEIRTKFKDEFNKIDKSTNLMYTRILCEKLAQVIPVRKLSKYVIGHIQMFNELGHFTTFDGSPFEYPCHSTRSIVHFSWKPHYKTAFNYIRYLSLQLCQT